MAGNEETVCNGWFDEISFDPKAPLLQMGTRRLGESGWLVKDHHRPADLVLKAQLMAERHDEVFAVVDSESEGALSAAERLLEMIQAEVLRWDLDKEADPGAATLRVRSSTLWSRRHA